MNLTKRSKLSMLVVLLMFILSACTTGATDEEIEAAIVKTEAASAAMSTPVSTPENAQAQMLGTDNKPMW